MEEAGSFNMDLDKGGRRECPSSPETLVSLVDLARKFDFLNN
jgi:hypothetical protein